MKFITVTLSTSIVCRNIRHRLRRTTCVRSFRAEGILFLHTGARERPLRCGNGGGGGMLVERRTGLYAIMQMYYHVDIFDT